MIEQYKNRYKVSRQTAGLTIEQAATMHGVSSRTLSYYESGHTRPHDDIVLSMMETYGCQFLGYLHFRNSDLGKTVLPEVRLPENDSDAAMQVWNSIGDLEKAFKKFNKLFKGKPKSKRFCEVSVRTKKINLIEQAIKVSVGTKFYSKKAVASEARNKRKEPPFHKRP